MNNTFFTHKSVIWLLITLVLAIGVHGTADALTFGRTTGDLQTLLPGEQFTLTFSLTRNSVAAVDNEGNPIYQFRDGATTNYFSLKGGQYYSTTLTGRAVGALQTTTPTGSRSRVYDYDNEQVTIDPGTVTLQRKIGSVNYPIPSTGTTLIEGVTSGPTSLANSITLVGTAPTTAQSYTITVSDATPAEDLPDGTVNTYRASNLEFTIYVVAPHTTSSTATFTAAEDQIDTGYDNPSAQVIQTDFATGTANLEVFYSVNGPGRLYVRPSANREGPSVTSRTSPLRTSTAATVYLETNRGTNKVTAWFGGQNPASGKTVTYIYRWSTLTQVSGSRQDGAVSAQLEDPFVVKLTDSIGTALAGQWISFPATGSEQYIPFRGTTYRYSVGGTVTEFVATALSDVTASGENVEVKTDDSGEAKIFFVPGTAGDYTVTPTFNTSVNINTPFTGTANTRTSVTNLRIASGNNQSAGVGEPLSEPLAVIVRYGNERREGVSVMFTVTSGFFTTGTLSGNNRISTVATNARGIASVEYVVGDTTAPVDVVASISGDQREVRFTVNGGGTTTPGTTPTGNNLSITPSRIDARAGDPITVTVNANRTGIPVTIVGSTGLNILDNGVTGTPKSITIPRNTTTGSNYRLTANATNYNSASIPVTVQGTQAGVTPLVTPPSISGNAGDIRQVSVRLSGAPDGTPVTIFGPFNRDGSGRVTVNTVSGFAQFSLRLPDTSGTATVSATSYTSGIAQLRYTVRGTPTTTQVRLGLASGARNQLSGAAGTNVQLRVRVTNTAGSAVSGVSVTFRSNNIDLATRTSGTNGEISVAYTVQTTAQTVTARINDTNYDSTGASQVTFTITPGGQQPTTSTLTIIQTNNAGQTSTSGAPGAPHTIRILLPQRTANQRVILDVIRTSDQTNVGTYVLSSDVTGTATTPNTFRLPTTPGAYTINATATSTTGVDTGTAAVTVTSIRLLKDTSDSVSGDNQEGNRGEVLDNPFVLKVVQANNTTAVQGVAVTFTVVDGGGQLSTSSRATSGSNSLVVRSNSSGDVRAYLVLGNDDEDNRVRASVGITNVADVFFDASGVLVPGGITIVSGNNQQGTPNRYIAQPFVVRVTDDNGNVLQGATVTFSLRGPSGTLTPRSATTDRNGEAEAELFPRAAGTYSIDARVAGVTAVRFTVTVGDLADSIAIVSGNNQSGDPGTELDNPLVVEVLDEDDDPVSGVTVTFSVTAGGGSLSSTSATTNTRGRAQTNLTLGDDPGRNTVRASVSGVSQRVTFTATAEDPAPPEPDIRLPAGQRADTYWINTDSGTIHRLVGSSVDDIAPSVRNVVSLVATKNKLFWVERTSNNSGRIRSANLNGGNIQLIRNLSTAPAGITVDTVNSKIYVTTERGKIQSINVDGSQYEANLLVGLDTPKDVAIDTASGKVFWITERGTVHYANVDGSGATQFASGYNTLGSIAVGANKVFWTEETSGSAGKIHSANLKGNNVTEIVSVKAAPYGVSVDAAAKKLYWTNSRGKIMQSNLNGKSIKEVVRDLVSLGDISVPAGTTAARPPGTFSKYDVNKDGVVDNVDASLVADALGETNPDNARLDVNGDGRVNFLDLLLVFDNRDETDAAPVADAKYPKVSPEEVQKQIDLLIASNNHSLTAQHTLAYLQSLLEVVSPERTRLLANYPNPFNPETWIPYQLATDSDVQITIYNTTGNVVRTLNLGHQTEGYYTDRSRAAYWDGRNGIGERVSSGVYFYVFTANEFSAKRKMLILK